MATLQEQIEQARQEALEALAPLRDSAGLEEWNRQYLGKKGLLTGLFRGVGALPAEERAAAGQAINTAKTGLEQAFAEAEKRIGQGELQRRLVEEAVDITLPGRPIPAGHRHIINQTARDVIQAFRDMGFQIYEGPDIELDMYNFELLNIPPEHPARSMQDTFYVDDRLLGMREPGASMDELPPVVLRTHTSPGQIRLMRRVEPPVRLVIPGRTYRSEATDATHEAYFTQMEGMAIDKKVTLADLKGTLAAFARAIFGSNRKVRFRCDYFPYVEPGVDLAIDCINCDGSGCRSCKYTGWLEILGAGMIHPQVLINGGVDPEDYSGFAFGAGFERIAMLRHGIDDIRLFYGNDLRFLQQF
ncbi:MAG: phenylalanine--tRNA ligase subunit alpha [Chloroflexota bacterium]|nr:phenylalanine--tRNA ligase subunit alpha [Chloroflexota bacterium]MDQ5866964.1 phenylalanine--tRNA ligase subunit alpha [Chloroflexota bacterium]